MFVTLYVKIVGQTCMKSKEKERHTWSNTDGHERNEGKLYFQLISILLITYLITNNRRVLFLLALL